MQESRALAAVTGVHVRARLELRPDLADVALLGGGDQRVLGFLGGLVSCLLGRVVGDDRGERSRQTTT